jgi:adenylosuccinate lyase
MRHVFEEEMRFQRMLDVEAALAWARSQAGGIPKDAAQEIERHASTHYVTVANVHELEKVSEHETMALVEALARVSGKGGAYVHLGATSSDILDTAAALQMRDGMRIIRAELDSLEGVLLNLSRKYRESIMIGRTHGQHALPITLGLKFAVWLREVGRHIERVNQCSTRLLVGKMSGAVGTMAGFGKNARQVQELVMLRLGLSVPDVTSQIVQRDRYAELVCVFAMVASSLDKFATEIRNLQRPEIAELAEPFQEGRQVGSSAMPQKRNPWRSENISSLAKIERSLVGPALESIVTWHERDLSQSAAERFIIPESFLVLDHMLGSMVRILADLRVDEKHMEENLMRFKDPMMSEAVMTALVKKGLPRQEAHKLLQELTALARSEGRSFREVLEGNGEVAKYLNHPEIDAALEPKAYLGASLELVDAAVSRATAERKARGLAS